MCVFCFFFWREREKERDERERERGGGERKRGWIMRSAKRSFLRPKSKLFFCRATYQVRGFRLQICFQDQKNPNFWGARAPPTPLLMPFRPPPGGPNLQRDLFLLGDPPPPLLRDVFFFGGPPPPAPPFFLG